MQAYGGMLQYVRWSCQRRGLPVDDKLKTEQFYTDPACQDIYSNMLATVTSRVNTFTGCAYRWARAAAMNCPVLKQDAASLLPVHGRLQMVQQIWGSCSACNVAVQGRPHYHGLDARQRAALRRRLLGQRAAGAAQHACTPAPEPACGCDDPLPCLCLSGALQCSRSGGRALCGCRAG